MKVLNNLRVYLRKLRIDTNKDWESLVLMFKADGNNLPNKITELRLIFSLAPGFLLLLDPLSFNLRWFAFFVFVAVSLTDKLDGYLARKYNQVTELGKLLDPAVDKILIAFTTIAIGIVYPFVLLPILVILVCELSVSWLSFRAVHRDVDVAVTKFGKAKMFLQCVAIAFLVIPLGTELCVHTAQIWAIVIAAALNVISLLLYSWVFYFKK